MSQPARIQILLALGEREACVCHLETALGMSQASISQHLMFLRKNKLVGTRRDGRHIYYTLSDPTLLDIFRKVAATFEIDLSPFETLQLASIPGCPCPICNPQSEQ
jgi:DNA-binding transcriptional ArsR family regulator